MALNDEEQAKLNDELAKTKQQLTDLLAKSKTEANDAEEAEKKRKASTKIVAPAADPDTLKEIAELKVKVAKLEERGGSAVASNFRLNFFGEK